MDVQFITSVTMISPDPARSHELYVEALGLPLQGDPMDEADAYVFSEHIGGTKHFGVWPLRQAAEACFGTTVWPADRPVPQVSVEFEVADPAAVQRAATELEAKGFELLHPTREEPWGQTVARLQSVEGAIVGVSHAPSLHK
jgi:catechol 2,3-dioxygenase-like lactoylglutathione lyase family enzyme